MSLRGRILAALAVLLLAGIGLFAFLFWGPGPKARSGAATTVILDHGVGIPGIATAMAQAHVIRARPLFLVMAKLTGGGRLQAGEYSIRSGESMASIIGDMKAGRVIRHYVTVPEGWTSEMVARLVNSEPVLTGQAPVPPEGAILPETYEVRRGEDRATIIDRMRAARDTLLAQLWASRAPGLPLNSPEEAVILASIVEKETGVAAERPRIAAVFENRLRAGIRLESDPTVIYGISKGVPLGRGLTLADLGLVTGYNTYRIAGLPPTPIANPGKAALEAVLNPPKSTEMFFVANGTGGHVFASTFEEHQRNVARWREIERERAQPARGS